MNLFIKSFAYLYIYEMFYLFFKDIYWIYFLLCSMWCFFFLLGNIKNLVGISSLNLLHIFVFMLCSLYFLKLFMIFCCCAVCVAELRTSRGPHHPNRPLTLHDIIVDLFFLLGSIKNLMRISSFVSSFMRIFIFIKCFTCSWNIHERFFMCSMCCWATYISWTASS